MGLLANRVKETSTATGSSNVALAGPVTQFVSFTAAFGTGQRFYYGIIDGDGVNWEVGEGYLSTSSTGVLIREKVTDSSNAGAAINLSANTHTVFSTITSGYMEDLTGKIYCMNRGFMKL